MSASRRLPPTSGSRACGGRKFASQTTILRLRPDATVTAVEYEDDTSPATK